MPLSSTSVGTSANDNNAMRGALGEKNVKVTLVIEFTGQKRPCQVPSWKSWGRSLMAAGAIAYPTTEDASVVTVARELVDWAKKLETLEFRGAILDGTLFQANEVERLSKFPTREEAQADIVQLVLSPAQNLVGAATSPRRTWPVSSKSFRKKLESGETIAKAS